MDPKQQIDQTTSAGVAAVLAHSLGAEHKPQVIDAKGVPVLLLPTGVRASLLDSLLPRPVRADAHVKLYTIADLVAYVKKHTATRNEDFLVNDHPVVFCDRKSTTITALLDYHRSAADPRWLNHTAKITFEPSHQFTRWKDKNGKRMSQQDFAHFLDEVQKDIENPTSAEVISFAENLEVHSNTVFKSSVRASTGETKLIWSDERSGDTSTQLIENFTVGIPFWQGGEKVAIKARLFHRIIDDNGVKRLNFWYELRHLEETMDHLFEDQVTDLRSGLADVADIYAGTPPEAPGYESLPVEIEAQ